MPQLHAYTLEECKKILRTNKLSCVPFWKWLSGQTGPILPNGEFGVYSWDLQRYIEWKKEGKKPLWD